MRMVASIGILLFLYLQEPAAGGGVIGRVFDVDRNPVAGAEVELVRRMYQNGRTILLTVQQTTTDRNGEYRLTIASDARYYLVASYRKGFGIDSTIYKVPEDGYPPIYYPGTPEPSEAGPIDLSPGGPVVPIDLTLYRVQTLKISGRVLLTDGTPKANAWLSILPSRSAVFLPLSMRKQPIRADGSFDFRGLIPGSYELVADSTTDDGEPLKGRVLVEVRGRDLEDINVDLAPAMNMEGRVRLENPSVNPALDLAKLSVSLRPESDSQVVFSPTGPVHNDGAFVVRKVGPGDYTLQILGLPPEYYVKSAYSGRSDMIEHALTIHAQSPGPIDVVISARAGRVEGRVVGVDDTAVPLAQIVLVPEPRLRERESLYKLAHADQDGNFKIRGIRPGSYRIFAWPLTATPAYVDPGFIRDVENRGESVQVDPESHVSLKVRVLP